MHKSILQIPLYILILVISTSFILHGDYKKTSREYYQLKTYYFADEKQEKKLDEYLEKALLPALHRTGIKKIGVFKSHSNDTSAKKTLYVFYPIKSMDFLLELPSLLENDKTYQENAEAFINTPFTDPSYSRMESTILYAFPLAPAMQLPSLNGPKSERIYELRSYESSSDKLLKNKIKMFNDGGEIGLFKKLNFNAVFYGEVISGSKMPNLMYMTCHENKTTRDQNWKNFFDHPDWKKLSGMTEYQHNVSHVDIYFLYPASYSDF